MKKLNFLFRNANAHRPAAFCWISFIAIFLSLGFFSNAVFGQAQLSAAVILKKIDREEKVELTGATISGDLDLTQLSKKYKGGSYGVRRGLVKEFYTKVKAPLILKNCTLDGSIVTRSDERTPGVLKENFVAFDAPVVFENCRFRGVATFESLTFYQSLTIKNCVFEEDLIFEKIHFAGQPVIEGNDIRGRLVNRQTNWSDDTRQLIPPPSQPQGQVTLILQNTSFGSIEIKFGNTKWTLSPLGKSTLVSEDGQEIFLVKNGREERRLLTVTADLEGKTIDIAKL